MVLTFERTWSFKETHLRIKCDFDQAIDAAISAALRARIEIERLILTCPEFRWSLEPVKLEGNHPRVIELMLLASELASVGPFAAVAGAISQVAAEAALAAGAKNVLVDNGGDISIFGDKEFRVGIFAGAAAGSGKLGFLVKKEELPIGICASSGTVGHSLSFGWADVAVAVADDAALADAAATSIGNAVCGDDVEQSIKSGLERAKNIPEIRGCLIIRDKHVGAWGKLPELISIGESRELLTTLQKYRVYRSDVEQIVG
ncbi:MAG: UPF0280 family protein [Candidatus Hadarchaeum sp.]|uniref:UPF0280 family protein n=1 Tax=Candidatus Hadarchaeum sp. TaxID=2883567 RepID=UPI003D0C1E13